MTKTHADQATFWLCYFFQKGLVEENTHQHVHLCGQISNYIYIFYSKLVFALLRRPSDCSSVYVGSSSVFQVT